jgi:hypothetical protein
MKVQWAYLRELLKRHQDTEFGRKYNFSSIHNIREYQERVPIHVWEDISPYMARVRNGNHRVLFPSHEKILMFAQTSGTAGQPKYIPVTETSYRFYGKYWDHTWSCLAREFPWAPFDKSLYFPGDPEEGYFRDVPYGAITAKAYAQQGFLKRSLYPYPYQVSKIKDYDLRYYTIMRISVEKKISIIPIANPSTILTLFNVARERADEIIEDIQNGQLRDVDRMPNELKSSILKQLRPNPKRANELKRILTQSGDFLPQDYWKGPKIILCFASGPLRLYLKQLDQYLDNFYLFDVGLLASEGRFSFPIAPIQQQEGCCLTLESNFFEFIPEDETENPNPKALTLDQCELGKRYFIIITNYSGLYRYNISDVVEVTGFYGKVPVIAFCNKGKHFSNITGEKLSEIQVTESVRRAGEKIGYRLDDFVVCLHWDENKPNYSLLKSTGEDDNSHVLQKLVNFVDEELMRLNVEYKSKRQSLRLGPLTLKIVHGHDYQDYEDKKEKLSPNLAQYKHTFLIGDPSFESQFKFIHEIPSSIVP